MVEETWDAVIAGCGLAGLSLAYALSKSRQDTFRILLIDREKRRGLDHTWCFWEKGPGEWDSQLTWEWQNIEVGKSGSLNRYFLEHFRYKCLESEMFYEKVWQQLDSDPRFHFVEAGVLGYSEEKNGVSVEISNGVACRTSQLFSSIPDESTNIETWQHFLGWKVYSSRPVFEPGVATLMDFQDDEDGDVRFFYILPTSEHDALVEYTVFGPKIWDTSVYTRKLINYLKDDLKVGAWMVTHEEQGAIPMTCNFADIGVKKSRIREIGTAGGLVKPSSGYAFSRIQRDSALLAREWKMGKPAPQAKKDILYHSCDATLLQLMTAGDFSLSGYFCNLFERWGGDRVLSFLDEQSSKPEVLSIMYHSPWKVFIPAWLKANFGH